MRRCVRCSGEHPELVGGLCPSCRGQVSAKGVYEQLLEDGKMKTIAPTSVLEVLKIECLNFPDASAILMRQSARLLSFRRNMPFGTWSNTNGGFHCGFFFQRMESIEIIEKFCVESLDSGIGILMIVDMLREMDPDEEYELYWFGN